MMLHMASANDIQCPACMRTRKVYFEIGWLGLDIRYLLSLRVKT